MRFTVWLAARDRTSIMHAAEAVVIALLLFEPVMAFRLLFGVPLLAHLAYSAMTSLPIGTIPGRPLGKPERTNHDLRAGVVVFLNEVRRVEDFAQRAVTGGMPETEVEAKLEVARRRILGAANSVAEAVGRYTEPPEIPSSDASDTPLLTHARPVQPVGPTA